MSPETTTGGNALKFYASIRLDIRRTGAVKEGEDTIGNSTRIKVVKNKLAPPFRQALTEIIFGKGICRAGELVELGVENDIVQKSGAWYSYGEQRLGQGKNKTRAFLDENPDIAAEIEVKLREKLLPNPAEIEEQEELAEAS